MVWQVAKRGRCSRLVGTPHFFPYHFRGTLEQLIGPARTVLLEGPLDEQSMRQVIDAGSGVVHASLYHALDAGTRQRICRDLALAQPLFIGVTHCPGVLSRLRADGFEFRR